MNESRESNGLTDEPDRVVFRDKRKIDPVTGEARPGAKRSAAEHSAPPAGTPESPASESSEVEALQAAVAERTADLQRVQAEYANYRKRADRDRLAAGDAAIGRVLVELLPVLDDIDRAREHGDLTGALKSIAEHLEKVFDKLGVEAFGTAGDPFDPSIHEAVLHAESDEVSVPTSTTVMRRGYRHGERLLRPAMVGVTDPVHPAPTGLDENTVPDDNAVADDNTVADDNAVADDNNTVAEDASSESPADEPGADERDEAAGNGA